MGNATNELVNDGRSGEYASARTTLWLFKNWMGEYHNYLLVEDRIEAIADFEELQPGNVELTEFNTPATDRHLAGGCDQVVEAWVRTDVEYEDQCEPAIIDTRNGLLASAKTPHRYREHQRFVRLPEWEPDLAIKLVEEPPEDLDVLITLNPEEASTGLLAVHIAFPRDGSTVPLGSNVVGSVNVGRLTEWLLEMGPGVKPDEEGLDCLGLGRGEHGQRAAWRYRTGRGVRPRPLHASVDDPTGPSSAARCDHPRKPDRGQKRRSTRSRSSPGSPRGRAAGAGRGMGLRVSA